METNLLRFVSFTHLNKLKYGAILNDEATHLVDLHAHFNEQWAGFKEVIDAGKLNFLALEAKKIKPTLAISDVIFTIPLTQCEKIICVGVNYPDRNEEYKDGQEAPLNPSLFIRFPRSFTGHNLPLIRPPESEQLDYEGEIVIIIGKAGRRISQENAYQHIAALSLANEGTLRDWVRHAKFNVTQGKNFDASGAIGPWLTPFHDKNQLENITLTCRVNGEVRQMDNTNRMIFSFQKIIAYISTFTTLMPGDMILTGTPTGAGARLTPPQWLKEGDSVEVEATGLGILRNTIKNEEGISND